MSDTSDLRAQRKAWRERNADRPVWDDDGLAVDPTSSSITIVEAPLPQPASERLTGRDDDGYAEVHTHVWGVEDPDA